MCVNRKVKGVVRIFKLLTHTARDGDRGIRDPEAVCKDYNPSPKQMWDFSNCEGDGHYLCKTCRWLGDKETD